MFPGKTEAAAEFGEKNTRAYTSVTLPVELLILSSIFANYFAKK